MMYIIRSMNAHYNRTPSGSSSFGRAKAFQALGGEFEPRLPLFGKFTHWVSDAADVAQG